MVAIACRVCPAATPHTRGSTFFQSHKAFFDVGYPAYAGIDPIRLDGVLLRMCLPRKRGDRPSFPHSHQQITSGTPHTRGSTYNQTEAQLLVPGYPAYAGIDPTPNRPHPMTQRLPRIRGDRPTSYKARIVYYKATPHTRGSTFSILGRFPEIVGYPAYAGIDLQTVPVLCTPPGLPRIRGDRPAD